MWWIVSYLAGSQVLEAHSVLGSPQCWGEAQIVKESMLREEIEERKPGKSYIFLTNSVLRRCRAEAQQQP